MPSHATFYATNMNKSNLRQRITAGDRLPTVAGCQMSPAAFPVDSCSNSGRRATPAVLQGSAITWKTSIIFWPIKSSIRSCIFNTYWVPIQYLLCRGKDWPAVVCSCRRATALRDAASGGSKFRVRLVSDGIESTRRHDNKLTWLVFLFKVTNQVSQTAWRHEDSLPSGTNRTHPKSQSLHHCQKLCSLGFELSV